MRTQQRGHFLKQKTRYLMTNIKLVITIVPIVLLMIAIFFVLIRNEILMLSKEKLLVESQYYAGDINVWSSHILEELNIYRDMIEKMDLEDKQTFEMMKTSYGTHDAYPYGLYWGDEEGNYFDSSGWVPEEDFVVRDRDWYREGLDHEEFEFGEPYVDVMTGGTCVSATTKISDEPRVSVLAADVYLDYASRITKDITKNNSGNALFVTEKNRSILADSDPKLVGAFLGKKNHSLLYRNINGLLDQGKLGLQEVEGEDDSYFVVIEKIENTKWYFINCMSRGVMLKDLRRIELIMVLVALVAAVVLIVVTVRGAREMRNFRRKAKTDPLTKLLNRDGFSEMMLLALETNSEQGILLILDMDHFKNVNDQLGHPEGDRVLKRFAQLLEEYYNRNKDIVARIGGDEFAVYVGRQIENQDVEKMLEKFLALVHQTFDQEYPEQKLSVSVGGSYTIDNNSYDALYKSADKALYNVKRKGRDGYEIWQP